MDRRLVRALAHPLRVRILTSLGTDKASPNQLATRLDEALSNLSYHTRVLLECDCIELVETRPARGAVEHFYRAKPHAFIGSREWQEVPAALRTAVAGESLQAFMEQAVASLEAGTLPERKGAGLTWLPMAVDERGWTEIQRALTKVDKLFREVGKRCSQRLADDPAIPVVVAFAAFETARNEGERQ